MGTEVEPGQRYTTQESFTITVVEELPAGADDGVTEQPPTDIVELPQATDDREAELPGAAEEEEEQPTTDTAGQ